MLKTSAPGKHQASLSLPFFHTKPEICPALTLKCYVEKLQNLRNIDSKDKLLISYKKKNPHNYVDNQTISRWIRQVMSDSGVDIKKLPPIPHDHASTSSAFREGVTLDSIFKTAGWSIGYR